MSEFGAIFIAKVLKYVSLLSFPLRRLGQQCYWTPNHSFEMTKIFFLRGCVERSHGCGQPNDCLGVSIVSHAHAKEGREGATAHDLHYSSTLIMSLQKMTSRHG